MKYTPCVLMMDGKGHVTVKRIGDVVVGETVATIMSKDRLDQSPMFWRVMTAPLQDLKTQSWSYRVKSAAGELTVVRWCPQQDELPVYQRVADQLNKDGA